MGLCPLNLEMVLLLGSIISSYEWTQEYICLKTANLKTYLPKTLRGIILNLKPSRGKRLRVDISLKVKSYPCLICFIRDS